MPGLALRPQQVQRLCGVDRTACQEVLDTLVASGFLAVRADGSYARAKNAQTPQMRTVKAELRPARATRPAIRNSA